MARRPRFTTRFSRTRDLAVAYVMRPLEVFQPRTRFLIGFAALVLITTPLLFSNNSSSVSADYHEGDVIRRDIVANGDITTVDISETERRRNAARQATRPIFNFDSTRGESSSRSFEAAWDDLKLQLQQKPHHTELSWSGEGGPTVARDLSTLDLSDDDLQTVTSAIREVADKYIYDDAEAERLNQEIVLVDVRNPAAQMVMPAP